MELRTEVHAFYVIQQFWGTVLKRFALCYIAPLSCLSVLSGKLVYCGQTVGWIKMKLGTQIGLGPGHIVLDGDPAKIQNGGRRHIDFHWEQ